MRDWDFEPENKELRKILKQLERLLKKYYCGKCSIKAVGCHCCRVWLAYENLKVNLN